GHFSESANGSWQKSGEPHGDDSGWLKFTFGSLRHHLHGPFQTHLAETLAALRSLLREEGLAAVSALQPLFRECRRLAYCGGAAALLALFATVFLCAAVVLELEQTLSPESVPVALVCIALALAAGVALLVAFAVRTARELSREMRRLR